MIIYPDRIPPKEVLTPILNKFGLSMQDGNEFTNLPLSDFFQIINQNVESEQNRALIESLITSANLFDRSSDDYPHSHMWPSYEERDQRTLCEELFFSKRKGFVNKSTKIVSLGSCFAIEIAKWLQRNSFNYIVKESTLGEDGLHRSSANWGLIFNTPSCNQVVEWAFGHDIPPHHVYPLGETLRDPFREDIEYSLDQAHSIKDLWDTHLINSRSALESAELIIITVGLNEVYEYLPTGHFLHRTPWRLNPLCWRPKILTVAENIKYLSNAINTIRQYNQNSKFIISVSPVPLFRTFRRDCHVAAATAHSKAVLRVSVEEVCNSISECHYFPSFETVMYPGEKDAWINDYRHVSRAIVNKVMKTFEATFCY